MQYKLSITIGILVTFATSKAQITGVILDKNKKPRYGILVKYSGASRSIVSDKNGKFEIQAKIGDNLIINDRFYNINRNPFVITLNSGDKLINIEQVILTNKKSNNNINNTIQLDTKQLDISRGAPNGDIFNGIPGLQLNNIRNEAGALDIGIRGLQGEGRVPVLIDGSLESVHTDRGYQGSSDRTYIDMDLIQKVKIDKGASFNQNAIGATGGVVEMKTISADDVVKNGSKLGVLVRGGIQNNTKFPDISESPQSQLYYQLATDIKKSQFNSGSLTTAIGYKGENFDFLTAVNFRTLGNYFAGKNGADKNQIIVVPPGYEVVNTSYTARSSLTKFRAKIGAHQQISFTYKNHYQKAGEVLAAYFGLTKYRGFDLMTQWSLGTAEVNSASLDYTYNPNRFLDINLSLFGNTSKFKQHNGLPFSGIAGGNDNKDKFGDQYLHEYENYKFGGKISNKNRFTIPFPIVVSYGINLQYERNYPIRPRVKKTGSARNGQREAYSLFVSAMASFSDKLSLQTNISIDHTVIEDYLNDWNINYGSRINTILQLNYKPFQQLFLYAKGSTIYKAPSLYESTKSVQSFNYSPEYPLTQENTKSVEVGATLNFSRLLRNNDRLIFGVNGFYNNTQNYISAGVLINPNITQSVGVSNQIYTFINYDKFMLKGLELALKYDAPKLGFINASSIFYGKSEVCSEKMAAANHLNKCNELGFSWSLLPARIPPKQSFMIDLGIRMFDEKLLLGGKLKYHSTKSNPEDWLAMTAAQGVAVKIPKDTIIDLYGEYKYKNISASIGVDNLTDCYKYDPGTVISMPIPGRTIRLGLEAKF
ncbi:MAG: TonB-dependent receptor plug domain-containing protein [Flavobacteriaceae bacterium]|jgi:hemoglobin/transferrin/lactoferrin receptor protein|nr:TonB-dependent receptor plug domain-containing protein [Flavobacteriaceae bacterium]